MSVPDRLLQKNEIIIYDVEYQTRPRRARFVLNMTKNRIKCRVVDETVFPTRESEFNIDRCVKYNEADESEKSIYEPSAIWEELQVNHRLRTLAFFKKLYKNLHFTYEMDIDNIQVYGSWAMHQRQSPPPSSLFVEAWKAAWE